MHIERLRVTEVVAPPHPVDQLATSQHTAGVAEEQLEQFEFLQRHRCLGAVHFHRVAFEIHPDAPGFEYGRVNGIVRHPPAKNGADPRQEFPAGVRFRHVIVCTQFQPDDDVDLGVLGREHDDRGRGYGADLSTDFCARHPREHEVEQYKFGFVGEE